MYVDTLRGGIASKPTYKETYSFAYYGGVKLN